MIVVPCDGAGNALVARSVAVPYALGSDAAVVPDWITWNTMPGGLLGVINKSPEFAAPEGLPLPMYAWLFWRSGSCLGSPKYGKKYGFLPKANEPRFTNVSLVLADDVWLTVGS